MTASTTSPVETFASQKELTQLAASWPAERLVAIWNSLPGVKPVKGLKNAKGAASRIWERIQGLGEPKPARAASVRARGAHRVPAKGKLENGATRAKGAPKAKKAKESVGPREGSKAAQVVALLQRKNGATISEVMQKMGWQKHTVRGFMAGAMKKAGYAIESFKPEGGERSYRINS